MQTAPWSPRWPVHLRLLGMERARAHEGCRGLEDIPLTPCLGEGSPGLRPSADQRPDTELGRLWTSGTC